MIKQVRMGENGEFGFTEILKHVFFSKFQKFTFTALFYCTSMICMSLQLKTLKNVVGKGAQSGM